MKYRRLNVYCSNMCPFMDGQNEEAFKADDGVVPKTMCPRVAANSLRFYARNIAQRESPDTEPSEAICGNTLVEDRSLVDSFLSRVEIAAGRFVIQADECALALINVGTINTSDELVRSVGGSSLMSILAEAAYLPVSTD